jgi:hypothetical protein
VLSLLVVQDVSVDRFWVRNFVLRHREQLCFQKAPVLEKDRHDVSPDEVRSYFGTVAGQLKAIPSPFVGNVDETRLGCPKRITQPEVIVPTNPKLDPVTGPEERDDAQLTLLTAISAFGDCIYPLFISKLKTFEKALLAAQKLYEGHDYAIRSAPRTFVTEVLFIDWLDTIFPPRIPELRRKFDYDGPSILIVDRHSTHVTPRVITLWAARNVIMIRLIAHSSHLAQPLDLCVFGLFTIFYHKERQNKGMKRETQKIYRALLAFYKNPIIPMVRWSFERADFRLNSDNFLSPLTGDSTPVLDRLNVPELLFDDAFVYPYQLDPQRLQLAAQRRRQRISGPAQFMINLIAYVDATVEKCPLYGHEEGEQFSDEEESTD